MPIDVYFISVKNIRKEYHKLRPKRSRALAVVVAATVSTGRERD